MLTRRQDALFSHAARLALRGTIAAADGEKPSSLRALLDSWADVQVMARFTPASSRRVALRILASLEARKGAIAGKGVGSQEYRAFGQDCVLIFKLGRGDDPTRYPLEFGEYLDG
jgi:hypothetical protein